MPSGVRPFFEWLGPACAHFGAVAMDMNTVFDFFEVAVQCPNAVVVYTRVHVIAKFGREVIDRMRVDQSNTLCGDRHVRRAIKCGCWLMQRDRSHPNAHQAAKLNELLAALAPLMQVYVLKNRLMGL